MNTENHRSQLLSFFWKIPVIAAIYFFGKTIAAAMVTNMGLRFPEIPGHTWNPFFDFLGGLVLVVCLAFIARGIGGSLKKRWLILLTFT